MAERGFLCFFRNRCGLWDTDCVREKATAENCMFIGSFEAEKKRVVKISLEILTKSGVILFKDSPYINLKYSVKYLTLEEFDGALATTTEQYLAAEGAKRTKKDQHYFTRC